MKNYIGYIILQQQNHIEAVFTWIPTLVLKQRSPPCNPSHPSITHDTFSFSSLFVHSFFFFIQLYIKSPGNSQFSLLRSSSQTCELAQYIPEGYKGNGLTIPIGITGDCRVGKEAFSPLTSSHYSKQKNQIKKFLTDMTDWFLLEISVRRSPALWVIELFFLLNNLFLLNIQLESEIKLFRGKNPTFVYRKSQV